MFCRNCGKENSDGSTYCKFCGQDFTNTIENNSDENNKNITVSNKPRKNKMLFISILVALVLIVSVVLFFAFRTNTPNIDQLRKDFMVDVLENKDYAISEFKIISDTDGKNDQYKAITEIVYDNSNIEYHRQYEFTYYKYKDWILSDISAYDKDSWEILPISAPIASDYLVDCETAVSYIITYDEFTPVDSKTTVDLTAEEATFVFSVEKDTTIQKISGEIEFQYYFNEKNGKWEMKNYSYADSYSVTYDIIRTWSGDGSPYLFMNTEDYNVNFVFEVTKYENETVEGILKYNNESYDLTGTLSEPAGEFIILNLSNVSEMKNISFSLDFDGTATANIDIAYIPDQTVYYGYMKSRYEKVEMDLI